jgi:SAM-dependent methyltransferase
MRAVLTRAAAGLRGEPFPSREILLLDVGGRGRPYAALFADQLGGNGHRVRHLVIDPGDDADVHALAEQLPLASGRADLVLCTQVLEHVTDPARAVAEMARVLRPGGVCLLTTHGTWFYHPDPEDYWRWTPAGLARLFREAGFASVQLEPVGGTKLALTVLGLTTFERTLGTGAAGALARRLLVAPVNAVAGKVLLGRVAGRHPHPGELAINYLVTARR